MSKTKLELKNVAKMKGMEEEFNRLLTLATEDCLARPGIKQKRQVIMTVELTPNPNDAEQVVVRPFCKSKGPVRKGADYVMNTTVRNELTFQPNSPLEPDQGDLFE
jgi:hypothetical protein